MTDIAMLQRAGLAVAIGLLIGIERGWQEREAQDGARVAGIRTFTLISFLGAICALIAGTDRPILMGLAFVGFAFPFGLFEYRRARENRSFSVTGFVTG
ncbi:MAG: MgtC/SapB family protein, partial [Proteobacteria bacterium]|nr:MgtC/SapB family protein [Pseudomonadota bacterium]